MTPQQLCDRIAYDLDQLTDAFLLEGKRAAAFRVIEMNCSFRGENAFGDESSPMETAQQIAEGGAA